jgi:hypothetical protein
VSAAKAAPVNTPPRPLPTGITCEGNASEPPTSVHSGVPFLGPNPDAGTPAAFLLSAKNKAAPGRTLSTGAASLRPPDRLRIGPLLAHIFRKVPGVRSVPHPLKLV